MYIEKEDILCFDRKDPQGFRLTWSWGQGKKEFSFNQLCLLSVVCMHIILGLTTL